MHVREYVCCLDGLVIVDEMSAQCGHCVLRHVIHFGFGNVVDVTFVLIKLAEYLADLNKDMLIDLKDIIRMLDLPFRVVGQRIPCHSGT